MKYFNDLAAIGIEDLFYRKPETVTKHTDKQRLSYSLGALLYMPATREDIAHLIITNKFKELVTVAICLEDAIGDHEVEQAENKLITHMQQISAAIRGRSTYRRNDSTYFCPGKKCTTDAGHRGAAR